MFQKMTVNAVMLVGYALGQTLAPQFWKAKYAPRYYIPWGIILVGFRILFSSLVLIPMTMHLDDVQRRHSSCLRPKILLQRP